MVGRGAAYDWEATMATDEAERNDPAAGPSPIWGCDACRRSVAGDRRPPANGSALICCSQPRGDLVLDL
jgi:hypothetical protein